MQSGPQCDSCCVCPLIRCSFSSSIWRKPCVVAPFLSVCVEHKHKVALVLLQKFFDFGFYGSKLHRLIICHLWLPSVIKSGLDL